MRALNACVRVYVQVAYNVSETNRIIDTVLGIQPRVTSTDDDAATPEQLVDAMAVRASVVVPNLFVLSRLPSIQLSAQFVTSRLVLAAATG